MILSSLIWNEAQTGLGTTQTRRARFLFVICELIYPFHDAAIAEAGEGKKSICEALSSMRRSSNAYKLPQLASKLALLKCALLLAFEAAAVESCHGAAPALSLSLNLPLILCTLKLN